MKYHYFALIEKEDDMYNVSFPDLPGCFTFGESLDEAIVMAKDVLEGWMLIIEDDQEDIPVPSGYASLVKKLEDNQMLQLIIADTEYVRKRERNKAVNKMVTLPAWLVDLGKEKKVNFSQLLQQALKDELQV